MQFDEINFSHKNFTISLFALCWILFSTVSSPEMINRVTLYVEISCFHTYSCRSPSMWLLLLNSLSKFEFEIREHLILRRSKIAFTANCQLASLSKYFRIRRINCVRKLRAKFENGTANANVIWKRFFFRCLTSCNHRRRTLMYIIMEETTKVHISHSTLCMLYEGW